MVVAQHVVMGVQMCDVYLVCASIEILVQILKVDNFCSICIRCVYNVLLSSK